MAISEKISPGWKVILAFLLFVTVFLSSCIIKTQRVYRVGILSGADPFTDIADGFISRMKELGYIDGKNIRYDLQRTNSDPLAEERILKEFIKNKMSLVFAFPGGTATTAKQVLKGRKIPLVFAMAGIEGTDLVESISRPGDHITGVRFPNRESTSKRLEILHELIPAARRIYIIYDAIYPNTPFALEAVRTTAASLGMVLLEDKADTLEEFKAAIQKRSDMDNAGIDAVLLMPDYLNHAPDGFGAIVNFADKHKLPIGGGMDFTAEGGAMFSLVPGNFDQGALAAGLADKILRGVPAGVIPVVTPELRLRINYKVIQRLGLKAPEGLLSRADEVIR